VIREDDDAVGFSKCLLGGLYSLALDLADAEGRHVGIGIGDAARRRRKAAMTL
jgi:hypothetical protein